MAGSSEITAIEAVRNTKALMSTGSVRLSDTGANAYLDVSDEDASKVIFIVEQTAGAAANVTFKNGAEYTGEGIGDYTFATTGAGEYVVGPMETHRFKDDDGYINIQAGTTGSTSVIYARAILLP
jgi:hypothetical protein